MGVIVMVKSFSKKILESAKAIAPIAILVLLLSLTIIPLSTQCIIQYLISCVFLIFGMSLFTLGADTAMIPVGQTIGSYLSKKNKILITIMCVFALGLMITIAEPDLSVVADQVSSINKWVFLLVVSGGVGLAMVLAALRTKYKWNLSLMLTIIYSIIFIMAIFVPSTFSPLCFDSGASTTGPISVPFMLAIGVGIAAVRGNNSSQDDSFGVIALCSAVSIGTLMLLGCFTDVSNTTAHISNGAVGKNFTEILSLFGTSIPVYLKDVAIILLPIIAFFMLFQCFALKLPKQQIGKILIGFLLCYIGITIFFVGVNVGFLPVGQLIGQGVINLQGLSWILVPIAIVLGAVMILAEPAVLVLAKQVEQVSQGKIKASIIKFCICAGVAISVGFCALRVLLGFPIWYFLVPCYVISMALSFVVPKVFAGIAFDSGGVATGAMGTTFVLPMMIGASCALGLEPMSMAFGTLAFIAVTPLLTLQILGLIYKFVERKQRINEAEKISELPSGKKIHIIEYD